MEKNNSNSSSNSLVFGRWPQAKKIFKMNTFKWFFKFIKIRKTTLIGGMETFERDCLALLGFHSRF